MTEIFEGRRDLYRCVHIIDITFPPNFESVLENSLLLWQSDGMRGVWLEIPNSQLDLAPICKNKGFYLHHVSEKGLVMAKWLLSTPNKLPGYSSHYIGAGGVIFNNEGNMLLIKDRIDRSGIDQWKLPGGLVDPGELVVEAACREVKEEAGLDTTPIGILCFREILSSNFKRPDIYFIVLLNAENFELNLGEDEISHACWMPFKEWLRVTPNGGGRNMLARLYGDSQENPRDFFRRVAMRNQNYEYITPNFTKTHYLHLPNPNM